MLLTSSMEGFLWVMLGSLLPDIDHPTSTLGKLNPLTRWMKHRGHCHSIIGVVLLCAPIWLLAGATAFWLVLAGCAGHLIGDKLLSWLPGHKPFRLHLW